jgi:hypothetical protein
MKRGLLLFAGVLVFAPGYPLAIEAVQQTSISRAFASAACAGLGLLFVLGAALRT